MSDLEKKRLIIIPVYNEAATIKAVLARVADYYTGEILLVNDGSTDSSIEQVDSNLTNKIKILHHKHNLGYGQSLIDGFQYARANGYTEVLTMDCDAQHEPGKIPEFFEKLDGYDIVSGSRYIVDSDSDDAPPADRLSINQQVTLLLNDILPFKLTDAFCGFKAYSVAALQKLSLDEPGYAFPLQLWIQTAVMGLCVRELPVPRVYSNLNRSFGKELDDPMARLAYYKSVIAKEMAKWK